MVAHCSETDRDLLPKDGEYTYSPRSLGSTQRLEVRYQGKVLLKQTPKGPTIGIRGLDFSKGMELVIHGFPFNKVVTFNQGKSISVEVIRPGQTINSEYPSRTHTWIAR